MSVKPEESIGRARLVDLHAHVVERSRDARWRRHFDMGCFSARIPWDYVVKHCPKVGDEVPMNGECGTSGCLLGHAVNVPSIREAGLINVFWDKDNYSTALIVKGYGEQVGEMIIAQDIFGISSIRANNIFYYKGGDSSVSPEEACDNLLNVIAQIDDEDGWSL